MSFTDLIQHTEVSESYKYLSNDESEIDTNIASTRSTVDHSFVSGGKILDNWDEPNNQNAKIGKTKANIIDDDTDISLANNSDLSPSIRKPTISLNKAKLKPAPFPISQSTPILNKGLSAPEGIMKKVESLKLDDSKKKRNVSFHLQQSLDSKQDLPLKEGNLLDDISQSTAGSNRSHILNTSSTSSISSNGSIDQLKEDINQLKQSLLEKELHLKDIEKQRQNTTKTHNKPISIKSCPSLAEPGNSGKPKFVELELQSVDKLGTIEAHNVIKNICIKLSVPYSKLPEAILTFPDILKSEYHLLKFSSSVHQTLYNSDIKVPIITASQAKSKQEVNDSRIKFLKCLKHMENKVDLLVQYVNEID